ncbi:hypothetical protein SELMODRAFT_425936 [Selaginella moellendorffii]|uniref:Pentacotripeptide-repeat region of PRORP domain-containing protein n=1 Tax=Selaginella moellendorffii TaxID=88036 RepID=D8SUT0_SELML|nr:hypothetical protein SELMODRAFT_425936 [Selaginella moellendorffii]
MEEKTLVSWNAMIGAYARLGREDLVLFLFRAMDLDGVRHNRITFLNAIAGIQSIDRGKFVQERAAAAGFEGDIAVRNALPKEEHYGSLIDMLAKAGWLQEAEALIETLPFHPFAVAWTSLLGASCNHKDVDRAERVAAKAIDREPGNAGPYISLSNMYATLNRWDDVARVKKLIASLKGGGQ